jgi:predicted dehydrogenase
MTGVGKHDGLERRRAMDEVRIGFIGCGGNARGHMRALENVAGAQIVAVCDVQGELAERAAAETGASAYTDHHALLERDDLHAVYISIPVFAHGAPERDVIARGLPFFVEKPVALDLATAQEIAARVRERNLLTCVGYQLRYSGATDAAREALSGAEIGMIVGRYWCGSGRGDPNAWLRRRDKSGGQLVEQATHTVDLMRYLGGEIVEVYAKEARRTLPEIDCADVHCLILTFANGALGSLTTTWAFDPSDWSQANVVEITYDAALLRWSPGGVSISGGGQQRQESRPDRSIDAVFIDAVRRGDRSAILSPYEDAVRSLAVSLAANASAQSGRPERIQ